AAARAGADAIKFQTFSPDELVTRTAEKAVYQKANKKDSKNPSPSQIRVLPLRNEESQHAMLKKLVLKREDHSALKSYAEKKGLIFLSTPFSLSNALFLKKLGVPAIKVSSGDANNIPFLARIAKWKLPILFSTGMSDMREIKESVTVLREAGNKKIIALQCT
ncbi:MAG TPA: N-acetylneuraminate synthase, partial [Candidatus Taylorbacteria bacterium]|nr:N-acetylneuraminate synthase [Candidatus Taylorbacteria bacterium]